MSRLGFVSQRRGFRLSTGPWISTASSGTKIVMTLTKSTSLLPEGIFLGTTLIAKFWIPPPMICRLTPRMIGLRHPTSVVLHMRCDLSGDKLSNGHSIAFLCIPCTPMPRRIPFQCRQCNVNTLTKIINSFHLIPTFRHSSAFVRSPMHSLGIVA